MLGTKEGKNQVVVGRYFIKKAFTCGKHISYHRCCPPLVAWRIGQFYQQLLLLNDVCLVPNQGVTWLERDQFAYAYAYQTASQHPSLLHQNQSHDGIGRLWQNRSGRQNLIKNSKIIVTAQLIMMYEMCLLFSLSLPRSLSWGGVLHCGQDHLPLGTFLRGGLMHSKW